MELDQILQLIDKVSDSSLTAFDYEADGIKIAMEHGKAAPVQVQMSGVPSGAGLQMAEMMGRSKWRDSERSSHAGEKKKRQEKVQRLRITAKQKKAFL